MPLFGCVLLVGLAIGFFFLATIYGFFTYKYTIKGRIDARTPAKAKSVGLRSELDTAGIPFEVPQGFVVRTVVRRLPCGKETRYYVVLPLDEPCSESADGAEQ